jgi:hypothetical protein
MPKGIMLVQTRPSDPAREDEYNKWYAGTHIPEVLAVPGVTGVRRYKLHGADGAGPAYLAIYELDAEDLADPVRALGARSASGQVQMSDVLQLDPPPVVTIYELIV